MSDEQAHQSIAELFGQAKTTLTAGTTLPEADLILERLSDSLGSTKRIAEFFEDKGLPLREAWVAVQFGISMGYERIQLAPKAQEGFDVTLSLGNTSRVFDITEAKDSSYNREDFYRFGPDTREEDHEEICRQQALFSKVVGNRLKRKETPHLVVYANTGWLPNDKIVEGLLRGWHDRFKDKFESAFLLIGKRVVQISPQYADIIHPESMDEII